MIPKGVLGVLLVGMGVIQGAPWIITWVYRNFAPYSTIYPKYEGNQTTFRILYFLKSFTDGFKQGPGAYTFTTQAHIPIHS